VRIARQILIFPSFHKQPLATNFVTTVVEVIGKIVRHLLYVLAVLLQTKMAAIAQVPEQDCINAIRVCASSFQQSNAYIGLGNVEDVPQGSSCLQGGENNSVWYTFIVQQSGQINFQIIPNTPSVDYDFALYLLGEEGCADIVSGTNQPVRCNYSSTAGNTGLSNAATGLSEGSSGPNQCSSLAVQAGEVYVLLVSNFSSSQDGYQINFGGSAIVEDEIAAAIDSVDMRDVCNPKRIDLWLTEPVLCNSIASNGSDIVITGPSGMVVQSAAAMQCAQGSTSRIRVILAQQIMTVGTYTITLVQGSDGNTFQDDCGNQPLAGTSVTFEVEFIGPNVSVNNINNSVCGQEIGSAHVVVNNGTAPFSYHWNTSPVQTTTTATNLGADDYTVIVTDANGCIETETFEIPNVLPISASVTVLDSVSCNGLSDGRARVVAAGGGLSAFNISWLVNPPQTGITATGLPAGNVTVEISDGNGCTWDMSVYIPQPPAFQLEISKLTPGCGIANGEISVVATGGAGGFQYLWSTQPPQTTQMISGLNGGVYSVLVTDQNGCSSTSQIDLPTDFGPEIGVPIRTPDCGQNSGEATVEVLIGQAPFTYEWSTNPVQTLPTATGLSQGFYYVVITDQTGCLQIVNVKIDSIPPPALQVQTTESDCGMDNGQALATTALGIPPFSYDWNGFPLDSTNLITGVPPGTYQVTVTDSIGCIDQQQFEIDEISPISTFTAGSVCIGQPMQFTSSSTSGATSWLWDFGDGTQSDEENPTHLFATAGSHEVSLMLSGGCADDSVTTSVIVNALPDAAFTYMPEIPVTGRSVTYTYTGTAVEQYEWNLGNGEMSTNAQPSATYDTDGPQLISLTVTDANGCLDTVALTIEVQLNPVLFFPNAFYPDGVNTLWHAHGSGVIEIELVIYTRTGQLVWEGSGFEECIQIGWDGTYKDKPVPQGVYAYHAKAQFYNGAAWEGIGTITLIR